MNRSDKKMVMVIEDDPNTAALVALYLKREGFDPVIAENGRKGLARAERYSPSLVILDLMLPELDGWEVCRRLRKVSEVPVIMLTARDEEIDRVAGLTLGADDYVVKPFSPRELMARAFNKMAKSLEEIENLRRSLMIDVAHELRTPLTNIRGYLEALTDQVLPPSTSTFSLLQDETLRLVDLVEEVLELARADASHGRLDLQPMDLIPIIRATLDTFSQRLAEKSITLNVQYPENLLIVSIDPGRINRVFRNLTDNAVQYTPKGGMVSIRFEQPPSRKIRIVYSNPSGELSSTDLACIFERFYRGEKSRSRQHGGAGIGLSIVKELIEAHGGQVGAERVDDQVHIWVELPIHLPGDVN
jgi:signal transduction histidine kinase